MGASKKFHLTQQEQIALGRAILRAEAIGRAGRAQKLKAFASVESGGLGLDWVRKASDTPVEGRFSDEDLLTVYERAAAATGVPRLGMRAVVAAVAEALDPFAGQHGTEPIEVTADDDLLNWLLATLDKLQPSRNQQTGQVDTSDDLVLAELEDRFQRVVVGTYVAPPAPAIAPSNGAARVDDIVLQTPATA